MLPPCTTELIGRSSLVAVGMNDAEVGVLVGSGVGMCGVTRAVATGRAGCDVAISATTVVATCAGSTETRVTSGVIPWETCAGTDMVPQAVRIPRLIKRVTRRYISAPNIEEQ